MPRKAVPINLSLEEYEAVLKGYEACDHAKKKRHWHVVKALYEQQDDQYSLSEVAKQTRLSEAMVRKIAARFRQEGLAYLERPYRKSIRSGRGRRRIVDDRVISALAKKPNVVKSSLAVVQRWLRKEIGVTVSRTTASRVRKEAKSRTVTQPSLFDDI